MYPPSNPLSVTAHTSLSALGSSRVEVRDVLASGVGKLAVAPFGLPFTTACGMVSERVEDHATRLGRYDTRIARFLSRLLVDLEGDLERAIVRWGPSRIGVFLGTSTAGLLTTEAAWREVEATGIRPAGYDFATQHAYDALIAVTRNATGITGPGYVISTACTSGAKVFGAAQRMIALGAIDAAIVGGVDTLCDLTLRGFHALGALAAAPCRPFSAERAGISIGEGGALLLLERSGEPRARLLAVGESSDAHHISAPHPEGTGARAAMESALRQAGLRPDEVGHINAHGTGTPLNDSAEARAIRAVFGVETLVLSTKGYCGHMLGAAGAIEAVFTIIALEEGWVPRSVGAEPVDPNLGLEVVATRTTCASRYALSNSLAFGGNNTSVLLGAP